MRHRLATAVFAQGWLEGQIENMVSKTTETQNEDPTAHLIASQVLEQWNIVSATMDDLIKENQEMGRKLSIIQSAF